MPLYHATLNSYSIGETIEAKVESTFYPDAVERLEATKPADAPSRAICLFASESLDFCYLFALKQQWSRESIKLYEVEMPSHHHAPMAIVHAIQKKLESGKPSAKAESEYWDPTQSWKFVETFGPTMTIVRKMQAPSINELILSTMYYSEADRASAL